MAVTALGAACSSTSHGGDGTGGTGNTTSGTSGSGGSSGQGTGANGGTAGQATGGTGGSGGHTTGGLGGTAGQVTLPELDSSARVIDLTEEQQGELCDWLVGIHGGYGAMPSCGNGLVLRVSADQAECIMRGLKFSCNAVTVGDVETCELATLPSGGCDHPPDACKGVNCMTGH